MSSESDKIKLLFVDDEEEFLATMARALGRRGVEVVCTTSALEALRLLSLHDFDVAVIDVKMPEMDGVELFQRLKKLLPHLPVIMLTGHGTVSQAFETGREGIFGYLSKPCEVDDLVTRIQAAAKNRPAPKPTRERESTSHGVVRVLLVDDEVELLSSLNPVLTRRGMDVSTASNGEEAIHFLENQIVDVVVLDIKMPGMDGIQTLRRIKADSPDVEVVLLTGHPDLNNAFEGMKLGAFDYIIKPPAINELVEKIKAAFLARQDKLEREHEGWLRGIMERYPD
jgi:DNA-binding NtrC family response regulator